MATSPPPFNPFGGLAPQRGEKSTFSQRFDAFITWFIAAVVQLAALAANVYANAVEAFQSAGTATNAAAAAMVTANATLWVSGATVAQYAAVISPADGRTYRRITAQGAGTTDPSNDTVNYVMLSGQPSSLSLLATATVSAAVVNIDFLNLFSSAYEKYVIELSGITPSALDFLQLRVANSGAVNALSVYFSATGDNATASLTSSFGITSIRVGGAQAITATIEIANVNSTTSAKLINARGAFVDSAATPAPRTVSVSGQYTQSPVVTGFRLFWLSGATFTAGSVRVYGLRNTP